MKSFNKKESGFTLIELLVVIAIIGLIASVVLVNLEDARNKGKNSAKNQLVGEYMTAIELYRISNNDEGYPNENTPSTYYCLGEPTGESCLSGAYPGNSDLNDEVKTFIPGPPADDTPIPYGGSDLKGIFYKCSENTPCGKYEIRWYLTGSNQECIRGVVGNNSIPNITRCIFDSETELEV